MRYIALMHSDNTPGFGVSFPDFPGCVSNGDTEDEAIRRGQEALTFHIENMAEDGERIPPPSACAEIEAEPDMAEWLAGARMVEVEIEIADRPPPVVTLPNDRLVRGTADIFGRRLARFVGSLVVPDLPEGDWGGVRVVLLLESPHKDEVPRRRPLVGPSGVHATKGLGTVLPAMRGADALGDLVASGDPRVSWLGIMNASRLPLQVRPYLESDAGCPADIPAWPTFAKCLPYIRGKRPVTERNEAALRLERAIVEDLQDRLDRIPTGSGLLLVCCGAIAQRIFERTQVPDGIRVAYTYHPSHDQWLRCANEMQDVYGDIARMCDIGGARVVRGSS